MFGSPKPCITEVGLLLLFYFQTHPTFFVPSNCPLPHPELVFTSMLSFEDTASMVFLSGLKVGHDHERKGGDGNIAIQNQTMT